MIIAISGKIGSGKDTVGKIIQYLDCKNQKAYDGTLVNSTLTFEQFLEPNRIFFYNWKIKKFAGKLKQIVSILTGIPVEDLEKQEVKDRVLGEEWQVYNIYKKCINTGIEEVWITRSTEKLAKEFFGDGKVFSKFERTNRTVRWLLQNVGTDAMRDVIHSNVWVNALMADYVGEFVNKTTTTINADGSSTDNNYIFPKWIITDCRFPNELEAVKRKVGSISIRVNRPLYKYLDNTYTWKELHSQVLKDTGESIFKSYADDVHLIKSEHESETALDNAEFDYVIDNNGTVEELIEQVKQILIKEKIL